MINNGPMPPNNLHFPQWLEDRWSLRRHLLRRWLRGRLEEKAGGGGGVWGRRLDAARAAEVGSATS